MIREGRGEGGRWDGMVFEGGLGVWGVGRGGEGVLFTKPREWPFGGEVHIHCAIACCDALHAYSIEVFTWLDF